MLCFPILFNLSGEVRAVYVDYHFYVRIIDFLELTGQENEYHGLNLLSKSFHAPRPYHFADIWTVLFSDKLTSLGVLKTIFLIASPFYIFSSLIGILTFFSEKLQKKSILKVVLIAFISLNCGGVLFGFYDNFNFINDYQPMNTSLLVFFSFLKELMLFPLVIAFFLTKRLAQKFSLLALIAISSFTLLPAILGAMLLEFVFLLLKERNLKHAKSIVLPILTCLSILLFYQIFKNDSGIQRQGLGLTAVLEQITHILTNYSSFVKTARNFVATLLRHGIFFWPFFVYWLVFSPKTMSFFIKKTNGRVAIFLLFAGAFTLAIFRNIINSTQLVYNITMPFWGVLTAILMISVLLEFIEKRKIIPLSIGLLLFIPALISKIETFPKTSPIIENRDSEYINTISQWAKKQKTSVLIGGSLKNNQRDYPSSYDKYVTIYTLGYELAEFIEKPFLTVSLNDLSIPISQDSITRQQDFAAINQGAFYNFAQQRSPDNLLSEETLLVAFIKEKKLTFIIAAKNITLPQKVAFLVEKKHIDNKTGEQFFILKHE